VLAALLGAGAACGAILGLEPPPAEGDDGGSEGAVPEEASADASTDAAGDGFRPDALHDSPSADGGVTCTPLDAGAGGPTYRVLGFHPTEDAGLSWEFYDTSPLSSAAGNYQGGAFDGHYVYLAPAGGGIVTRYDTTAAFVLKGSWSTFDTTPLGGQGFSGAVYDGSRYVYFVPYQVHSVDGGLVNSGLVVRYDTHAAFASASAWSVFDTTTLGVAAGATPPSAFHGAVFDGQYIYFVPSGSMSNRTGRVARFDTTPPEAGAPDGGLRDAAAAIFATPAQWATFDIAAVNASGLGFVGGVSDGKRVYFVPFYNGAAADPNGFDGIVVRYDTTTSFTMGSAWTYYDLINLDQNAIGFEGAAFDGRYVYLAPHDATLAVRYDSQALVMGIGRVASWSTFDMTPLLGDAGAGGFWGTGFDGRFVYYVPNANGRVVRYDTLSPFGAACAWSAFDVSTINASAKDFAGAVYDGRWLYFVPQGTIVARFDTKTPSSMPPGYSGSFY
jgi:hypothetical protein